MTLARSTRLSLFALLLAAVGYHASAQVVTVGAITDPGTIQHYLTSAQNELNIISNTAAEVAQAEQTVQYQIQALQSLGTGTWQGFVNAMDYEAASWDDLNAAMQALPSLSQIDAVDQLINSQGYQAALGQVQATANSFNAADAVTHAVNNLSVGTHQRLQAEQQLMQEAESNTSPVQLAQEQIQGLGLLQAEIADTKGVLQAQYNYEQVQIDNERLETETYEAFGRQFDNGTTTYKNVEPDASTVDKNSPAFQPH